jgi:DNA-binding FadR family transcriptional regulator
MNAGADKKENHPSVRLARRFVEAALKSRQFSDGERLPPLRLLARKARISPAAMLQALHLLAADGLVTILKNHGTYAGRPEDRVNALAPEDLERPPREKWQRLRIRLEQDVYAGRFPKGADLPSLRDLAPRYGTSPPTLRKAMTALERAGVVEIHGRAYRVPRPAVVPGQAGLLFTAYVPPEEADLWFRRDRYMELLAALHRACAEANLRLLISSYHPKHGFRWRAGRSGSATELKHITLRGHLAWAPTLSERDLAKFCSDLAMLHERGHERGQDRGLEQKHGRAKLVKVGSREMPLAIFDGARGTQMAIPRSREYACTRLFSIARKRSGEHVARFLLAAGHRRIAFLSACHLEPWSKDRLSGLRSGCEAAGYPEAVKAFTLAARDDMADKPDLAATLRDAEAGLGDSLGQLERAMDKDAQAWLTMPLRTSLELFRGASRTGYALRDPVARLQAWGPTACVAANDVMALTAVQQLRRAGVRVPEDMVVVGFDDDKYAADNNLTSYNFNMAAIAESMLRFVLAPEKSGPADRDGSVECAGILIERGSTPARNPQVTG